MHLNHATKYFNERQSAFMLPTAKLPADAVAYVNLIAKDLDKLGIQNFQQLPTRIRAAVIEAKPNSASNYLDPEAACSLVERAALHAGLRQACQDQLCKRGKQDHSLRVHGPSLLSEQGLMQLLVSIPITERHVIRALDLSSCHLHRKLPELLNLFPQLQELKLSDNPELKSLDGIDQLGQNLVLLEARGLTSLSDISALRTCPRLRELDLSGAQILDDLAPLEALGALQVLTLTDCSEAARPYTQQQLNRIVATMQLSRFDAPDSGAGRGKRTSLR